LFDLYEHKEKKDIKWEDVTLLKIGRHFRLSDDVKLIVGRHERENILLEEFASGKIKMSAIDFKGPIALVEGNPNDCLLKIAAAITARYGKGRDEKTVRVRCQYKDNKEEVIEVNPEVDDLERWRI
jgi:predicted ribosome quality control (RQC) complex YloA/Tae2 family protein